VQQQKRQICLSLGLALLAAMPLAAQVVPAPETVLGFVPPARSYQHHHAGVRILSETASARLATPIETPFCTRSARAAELQSSKLKSERGE
jgi:hypothetical protein